MNYAGVRLRSSHWKSRWHGNKCCHAEHFSRDKFSCDFIRSVFRYEETEENVCVSLLAVFKCNSLWNHAQPHSITVSVARISGGGYCCCCCCCDGNIRDNRLLLSSKSNRHFCFSKNETVENILWPLIGTRSTLSLLSCALDWFN